MNERFQEKMHDAKVAHDVRVLADFVSIYCDGHHADRVRRPAATDAAALGLYGRKTPTLCEECEAHLGYGEQRRAYCPKQPKPFCAHCDTHCYKSDERTWQQQMMRYSGPRSWRRGHAIDGIKHVLEKRKWKRAMARRDATTTAAE
jgi:predicted amidophosphoribosyltransferase